MLAFDLYIIDMRHGVIDSLAALDNAAGALSREHGARTIPRDPPAHDVGDQKFCEIVLDRFRAACAGRIGTVGEVRSTFLASAETDSASTPGARVGHITNRVTSAQ